MRTESHRTLDRDLVEALADRFGRVRLTPLVHEQQRNETWRLQSPGVTAVVKRYRWLSPAQVADLSTVEEAVRAGGVPVPEVFCQLPGTSVVVHQMCHGRHAVPVLREQLRSAASCFARQLGVLAGVVPSWTALRPARLPARAQRAVSAIEDPDLAETVKVSWHRLGAAAIETTVTTSHTDWRVDNLLFRHHDVSAVLDWEDLVRLPAAEAIGLAAVSVTHSWRRVLYQPLRLEAVTSFLSEIEQHGGWLTTSAQRAQAHLACRYAAAVRLAEDRARGFDGMPVAALWEAFP